VGWRGLDAQASFPAWPEPANVEAGARRGWWRCGVPGLASAFLPVLGKGTGTANPFSAAGSLNRTSTKSKRTCQAASKYWYLAYAPACFTLNIANVVIASSDKVKQNTTYGCYLFLLPH
jgi:hypothetical protein